MWARNVLDHYDEDICCAVKVKPLRCMVYEKAERWYHHASVEQIREKLNGCYTKGQVLTIGQIIAEFITRPIKTPNKKIWEIMISFTNDEIHYIIQEFITIAKRCINNSDYQFNPQSDLDTVFFYLGLRNISISDVCTEEQTNAIRRFENGVNQSKKISAQALISLYEILLKSTNTKSAKEIIKKKKQKQQLKRQTEPRKVFSPIELSCGGVNLSEDEQYVYERPHMLTSYSKTIENMTDREIEELKKVYKLKKIDKLRKFDILEMVTDNLNREKTRLHKSEIPKNDDLKEFPDLVNNNNNKNCGYNSSWGKEKKEKQFINILAISCNSRRRN
jgi:hypothetical protein